MRNSVSDVTDAEILDETREAMTHFFYILSQSSII